MFGVIAEGAGKLMLGASSIIDKLVTNAGERGELKNQFTGLLTEYHTKLESELSARHLADMNSDSWLSKNIRPLTLVFLLVIVSIMALFDGNVGKFTVNVEYIGLYKQLLLVAFSFYFGSRGVEKIMESIGKYQIKTKRQMNLEAKADLERAKQGN